MTEHSLSIHGRRVPRFVYGTAWKEQDTQRLTELSIEAGFRGIDTANQRRHYFEAAVGQAITACRQKGLVTRDDLFLQSKFTHRPGQDHRLPYDPHAPTGDQVDQSLASSLEHLGIDVLDSYLLHGPLARFGLAEQDWQAWRAMEENCQRGRVRLIGISNVTVDQLDELCQRATIVPSFVQNRCFAAQQWDKDVRQFCMANGIHYQGFSLLTANRPVLEYPQIREIAQRTGRHPSQIVFRFALQVGMIPLTGTTSAEHMQMDLEVFDFQLEADEVRVIEDLVAG